MPNLDILQPPGLDPIDPMDVTCFAAPGRGRVVEADGSIGLDPAAVTRLDHAAWACSELGLLERGGYVVTLGNKTPRDTAGNPWTHPDTGKQYGNGPTEAWLGKTYLVQEHGLPAHRIVEEDKSWDTPTNLSFGRPLFGDGAVAIVAQRVQLERIMRAAPRVLTQPFLGIVVPDGEQENGTLNNIISDVHTRYVLRGARPMRPDLDERIVARSERAWRAVLRTEKGVRLAQRVVRH